MITWQCLPFTGLTTQQLYELLKLRVDVFVVEQACAYPELDDKDIQSDVWHLLGYQDQSLIAYARLLAPGISYPSASIGRVATQQQARGNGLGRQLLDQALVECQRHWPEHDIEIGAKHYLASFYQSYGFQPTSAVYLEDDIPHIDMKLVK